MGNHDRKLFDPDAPAAPSAGVFGLDTDPEVARILLVPVPFDATTSFRQGTSDGPTAILAASHQVDLYDIELGPVHEVGIAMLDEAPETRHLNDVARTLAQTARQEGADGAAALEEINRIGDQLHRSVQETVARHLSRGAIVGTIGGDHSVAFGAIVAHIGRHPELGVLHIDAHADLRLAFEGFRWSHASVMRNVMENTGLKTLVQVGVRDVGKSEVDFSRANPDRVATHFDTDMSRRLLSGTSFATLAAQIVERLPQEVYVSLDVDGLEPALCPNTGTPVPGGLSFGQLCLLLATVTGSGRRLVGFDLTEVAPGPGSFDSSWDANVGARLLYKLCGHAACPSRPAVVG
jgi:agmatinase